jgi:uncharacterized damage-inducible protein DinB
MDMIERPRWAQRTFRFGHPLWMLTDFIERLRGTRDRLAALLHDVPDDQLHAPIPGSWSVAQHAGHLADVEELWLQRIDDLQQGRTVFTPARGDHFTALANRHIGRSASDILAEFARRCGTYVAALATADPALQQRSAFHERLQCDMRLVDGAQFVAEHDDHHLLRIRQLLASPTSPS